MRISKGASHALTAVVSLAVLAACSGSPEIAPAPLGQSAPSSQPSQTRPFPNGRLNSIPARQEGTVSNHTASAPSFFRREGKGKALIFVTESYNGFVDIYLQSKKHKMVGQITGLYAPEGLAADTDGNLYVTNYGPTDKTPNILIYAPPYTKGPKLTLDDGGFPLSVAVSRSGVVAAANFCSAPSCGTGTASVTLYAKNSAQPCATIADLTNFAFVRGVTFDHNGNLYVGGYGPGPNFTATVGEIQGGCRAKKIALLSTANPLAYSYPLHMDKAGRIAIYDQDYDSNTHVIDAYDPPKKHSLGSPVTTTVLRGSYGYDFAFLASGRDLWFSSTFSDTTDEYDYPAGGAPKSSVGNGDQPPYGVAVYPPLIP